MSTQVSVADIIRCGACDARFQQMIDFLERHGIDKESTIDIDEMISIFNANRYRHFGFWLNEMRPHLLRFTQVKTVTFEVNGASFNSIDDARIAALQLKEQRKQIHLEHATVAFSEALDEGHSWLPIDIDSFEMPEGVSEFHFHVFDHETGVHTEAYTVEEAKQQRDAVVAKMLARDTYMWNILKKTWFEEHEGAVITELVE